MYNKKAQWNWIVAAAIALLILVVSWFIVNKSLGTSNKELTNLQSCEGRNGQCKSSCSDNEISYSSGLGCGSGDYKDKKFCCIPEQT